MSTIYVTCGIPGSGKSHWAETHKDELNAVIHSSDYIRAELSGDMNDQSKNDLVFKLLHQRIKDDLREGKNVIYDATNLKRKLRRAFLQELQNISCEKICVLFATPFELALARNFARDRQVPEEVLCRMYKSFETPWYSESWDDIQIVWADYKGMVGFEYNINADMEKWKKISHDNPHHRLNISDHMDAAYKYYIKNYNIHSPHLDWAVYMHDIGKPWTKSFIDCDGNRCETAHFFEHQNVGAYLALFYLRDIGVPDEDILYISLLINLHMRPFLAYKHSDKAEAKDRRLFGDKIVDEVLILHECDKAAH
jgi:predicted kinase